MESINTLGFHKVKEICSRSQNIVIITHRNPDGDAVGSSLGLYHLIKRLKKTVTVITPNEYPDFLHWLPGNESVIRFNKKCSEASKIIAGADLIFFLDFNSLSRITDIDKLIPSAKGVKVLIDHHPEPEDFTDFKFSTTEVSSTAELVFEFINTCNFNHLLDKEIAECLFAGIMTDTVSFNVNAFRPRTFAVVSELLKQGVDFDKIHDSVFNNYSESRTRLLGHSLKTKMKILKDCNTAYIALSRAELDRYNFSPGDSEGFVNFPLSIKGIVVSALFIEKRNHVKISFRSKGNVPVNELAKKYFNGGGHLNAAGGEYYDSLQNTIKLFRKVIPVFSKAYIK